MDHIGCEKNEKNIQLKIEIENLTESQIKFDPQSLFTYLL